MKSAILSKQSSGTVTLGTLGLIVLSLLVASCVGLPQMFAQMGENPGETVSGITQIATGLGSGNPISIISGIMAVLGLGGTGFMYRKKKKEIEVNDKLLETIDYLMSIIDLQKENIEEVKRIQGSRRDDIRTRVKRSKRSGRVRDYRQG